MTTQKRSSSFKILLLATAQAIPSGRINLPGLEYHGFEVGDNGPTFQTLALLSVADSVGELEATALRSRECHFPRRGPRCEGRRGEYHSLKKMHGVGREKGGKWFVYEIDLKAL